MKCYIKEDDEIIADNVKLNICKNGQFRCMGNSLAYANLYAFDEKTKQEYEIEYEMVDDILIPYYEKPSIN